MKGFTYIGVLFFVALAGIALAGVGVIWHTETKREKERELLFIGDQFRRAIGQYYERSVGAKRFPTSINDLLIDRRYPTIQRYLRKIYRDPFNLSDEWGVVQAPGGGISGVFSLSENKPLKQSNFSEVNEDFAGSQSYRDWRFIYIPSHQRPTDHLTPSK